MRQILYGIIASLFAISTANAGSGTINVTPGSGATYAVTTDGSGNFIGHFGLWDYAAGANGAGIDTSHGLLVDPAAVATWGLTPLGGTTSSPTNAWLAGCQYLASAPTYTTGDSGAIQCTINGYPIVSVANTNPNGTTTAANSSPVTLATNSPGIITLGPAADTSSVPVVQGPTSSATSALSKASTTALGTSLVVKASAGNLYGFNVTGVAGAAAGYAIVYNGTTAPGTGALTGANVLDFCYFDTTARGCALSYIPLAAAYSTGIVVLVSSAASPYTYTTGTDTAAITAVYK